MQKTKIEEDAKYYDVPVHFLTSIKRGEWGAVRGYAQHRWNEDGYVLLRRYQNAVNRIIQVFMQEKNYPDTYIANISQQQKKQIAYYINVLGVKALIDDIRSVCRENPKIRTLNYFLTADQGKKTSRWGMMYFDKMHAAWQKRKEEELNCHVGQEIEIGEKVKEQWQIDAEARIAELGQKKIRPPEEELEYYTLKQRIARHGVSK